MFPILPFIWLEAGFVDCVSDVNTLDEVLTFKLCSKAQLLQGNRLLLIVSNQAGDLLVFLDHLHAIDGATKKKPRKLLRYDKIGRNISVFDESRRMLMIVSSDKVSYIIFSGWRITVSFRTAFIACS